jgi:hypothetical protein
MNRVQAVTKLTGPGGITPPRLSGARFPSTASRRWP